MGLRMRRNGLLWEWAVLACLCLHLLTWSTAWLTRLAKNSAGMAQHPYRRLPCCHERRAHAWLPWILAC